MSAGGGLTNRQRRRRARHILFWKIVNPPTRWLAGVAPWWVLLETTGRHSGTARRTPLARGPIDGNVAWLISVHGEQASWVRNLIAKPAVRIRISGRWRDGRGAIHAYDGALVRRFGRYARSGPRLLGIEPVLVRLELEDASS